MSTPARKMTGLTGLLIVAGLAGVAVAAWKLPSALASDPAAAAPPSKTPLAMATDPGERTYLKWCAPCHAPGVEHPGTNALAARYGDAQAAALIEQPELDPELVKVMVREGISVMPAFRKTEISDAELDALASWLSAQGKLRKKDAASTPVDPG